MLVATFGPASGWAGRAITHDGARFVLDGFGPITARAVLDYDGHGQLDWAYAGLRDWVQQVETTESAAPPAPVSQSVRPTSELQLGVVGFVLSLAGFIVPVAWIAGLVLCWIEVRRARRSGEPHGLPLAGLIISCIGTVLIIVGALVWILVFAGVFASFWTMS